MQETVRFYYLLLWCFAVSYECATCSKTFKTEQYLKMHMVIHSNDKPFQCDMCPNSFNRKDKLKRHLLIHDPIKRFKCPLRNRTGTDFHCCSFVLILFFKLPTAKNWNVCWNGYGSFWGAVWAKMCSMSTTGQRGVGRESCSGSNLLFVSCAFL